MKGSSSSFRDLQNWLWSLRVFCGGGLLSGFGRVRKFDVSSHRGYYSNVFALSILKSASNKGCICHCWAGSLKSRVWRNETIVVERVNSSNPFPLPNNSSQYSAFNTTHQPFPRFPAVNLVPILTLSPPLLPGREVRAPVVHLIHGAHHVAVVAVLIEDELRS